MKTETINGEKIIHITVVGDNFEGSSHLPFSEQAIYESVTSLCVKSFPIPDFEEGYLLWKQEFDEGRAGIFNIPVAQILSS